MSADCIYGRNDSVTSRLRAAQSENARLRVQLASIQHVSDSMAGIVSKLATERLKSEQLEAKCGKLSELERQHWSAVVSLSREKADLAAMIQNLSAELETLKAELTNKRELAKKMEEDMRKKDILVRTMTEHLIQLKSKLRLDSDQVRQREKKLTVMIEENKTLERKCRDQSDELDGLREAVDAAHADRIQIQQLQNKVKVSNREEKRLKEEIQSLKVDADMAQDEIERLRKQILDSKDKEKKRHADMARIRLGLLSLAKAVPAHLGTIVTEGETEDEEELPRFRKKPRRV